jgi:hypothetical protein
MGVRRVTTTAPTKKILELEEAKETITSTPTKRRHADTPASVSSCREHNRIRRSYPMLTDSSLHQAFEYYQLQELTSSLYCQLSFSCSLRYTPTHISNRPKRFVKHTLHYRDALAGTWRHTPRPDTCRSCAPLRSRSFKLGKQAGYPSK